MLDLFDRIFVNRYNADGTIRKRIHVPVTIHFSKVFADFILNTQDKPESKHTTPILGLRMGAVSRNAEASTARTYTRELYDVELNKVIQDARPAPWMMTYTLTSYTESIYDHFQIMQSIVPFFNPSFNTSIKEFEFSNLERNVIVTLTGVNPTYNDELEREAARSYTCEYTFNVKFDMYVPFYLSALIKSVNMQIAESGRNIESIKNIQVNNVTIDTYNRKMNELVSVGKLLDTVVESHIEQVAINEFRKYVEVGDDASNGLLFATIPAGAKITYTEIAVLEPFNNISATASVGTISSRNTIMRENESNLTIQSRYTVEEDSPILNQATDIYLYLNPATSNRGSLEIIIRWE